MNAQLFCVLIVKLFEITKFHRRLIFLLKAVINTAEKYYKHIICKIKLKGKMQYRKRTKTLYLSNKQLPLSTLDSVIEYGKAPAITPFGIVGIKL
jgi:ribosomal protein S3